ncbi:hypothetical protein CEXT_461651 [Caerostris extrusa]|uniref:Uncharacterized protein n=1 Tax=Caerostris extrusa TaxID=172846 RepID=A0AAV4T0P4_CAEEX|nr:hypothetical protein CEXT_461651 [Caerostris extrusa]
MPDATSMGKLHCHIGHGQLGAATQAYDAQNGYDGTHLTDLPCFSGQQNLARIFLPGIFAAGLDETIALMTSAHTVRFCVYSKVWNCTLLQLQSTQLDKVKLSMCSVKESDLNLFESGENHPAPLSSHELAFSCCIEHHDASLEAHPDLLYRRSSFASSPAAYALPPGYRFSFLYFRSI